MKKENVIDISKVSSAIGGLNLGEVKNGTMVQVNGFVGTVEEIDGIQFLMVDPKDLKVIEGNRPVNQNHVEKLASEIKKENLLHYDPIKIVRSGGIVDGQHRTYAALLLGLQKVPVTIVSMEMVGEKTPVEMAIDLNQFHRNWQIMDYAHSYATGGNRNYQRFLQFKEDHKDIGPVGISANDCMILLGKTNGGNHKVKENAKNTYEGFRAGRFEIKDGVEKDARLAVDQLREVRPHYKWYFQSKFVKAFLRMRKTKGYNHKHFLENLAKYGSSLKKQGDARSTLVALQKLYNFKERKKVVFLEVDEME